MIYLFSNSIYPSSWVLFKSFSSSIRSLFNLPTPLFFPNSGLKSIISCSSIIFPRPSFIDNLHSGGLSLQVFVIVAVVAAAPNFFDNLKIFQSCRIVGLWFFLLARTSASVSGVYLTTTYLRALQYKLLDKLAKGVHVDLGIWVSTNLRDVFIPLEVLSRPHYFTLSETASTSLSIPLFLIDEK